MSIPRLEQGSWLGSSGISFWLLWVRIFFQGKDSLCLLAAGLGAEGCSSPVQ